MSRDCCEDTPPAARRTGARTRACPSCGHRAQPVPYATLLHQLAAPLNQAVAEQVYWFCAEPACGVVYFGRDGTRHTERELRESVGQKSRDPERLVCYCFGITAARVEQEAAAQGESASQRFVLEQTRRGNCACETRNPSGKCCLRDFAVLVSASG